MSDVLARMRSYRETYGDWPACSSAALDDLVGEIEKLRAEKAEAERDAAVEANHSVAVCALHIEDITLPDHLTKGCLVCEIAALRARAEDAEARIDEILRHVWRAVGNKALLGLEVWDAVAAVREAVVEAEADNARLRAALTVIGTDQMSDHDDCVCRWCRQDVAHADDCPTLVARAAWEGK